MAEIKKAILVPAGLSHDIAAAIAKANPDGVLVEQGVPEQEVTETNAGTALWLVRLLKGAATVGLPMILPAGLGALISAIVGPGLGALEAKLSKAPVHERWTVEKLIEQRDTVLEPAT